MFVVFFVAAIYFFLNANSVSIGATTIMQQIYAQQEIGAALLLTFAGIVDAWYFIMHGRLRKLEAAIAALPKEIAHELVAALNARHGPASVSRPAGSLFEREGVTVRAFGDGSFEVEGRPGTPSLKFADADQLNGWFQSRRPAMRDRG